MDWKSWQWQMTRTSGVQTYDISGSKRFDWLGIQYTVDSNKGFLTNKIVFSKVIFDLVLPFAAGIYALFVLFSWKPLAAKIVSIIHQEQSGPKKSSIVFINSGSVFIKEKDSEGLVTIIVPFKNEASCDGQSPKNWSSTTVDKLHRGFLGQLG